MELSGARTRSSGSEKSSASKMTCGLRFNGAGAAVEIVVGVSSGRGVKVSVTGIVIGVGMSGVREARSGAGVTIPHAEESMKHVNNTMPVRKRVESIGDNLNFIGICQFHQSVLRYRSKNSTVRCIARLKLCEMLWLSP